MRRLLSAVVGVFVLLTGLSVVAPVGHALTLQSSRDCDSNAVIRCGALDFNELENRSSQAGAAQIYSNFGISGQDINNLRNVAVEGVVTNKNNVWINRSSGLCPNIDTNSLSAANREAVQNNPNLCLVATNATTAGRQNIAGSTAVTSGGVTFYTRPPSVSFVSSSLPAFVVMNGGNFSFAIIGSCGNPVTAAPLTHSSPTKPAPAPPVKPAQTSSQTQTQSQTVTINNSTPAVQAATTTAAQPAAASKTLPNTGPGNILALSGTTTAIGTLGHMIYSRRNRRSR